MKTLGNLGGFVCAHAFGYVVEGTGSYDLSVQAVAAVVLVSAGHYSLVDCTLNMRLGGWGCSKTVLIAY